MMMDSQRDLYKHQLRSNGVTSEARIIEPPDKTPYKQEEETSQTSPKNFIIKSHAVLNEETAELSKIDLGEQFNNPSSA